MSGCRAVVLAHGADASALWMFQRLRARSSSVHLVLAEELDTAVAAWEHHVGNNGVRTTVELPGARRLTTMHAGAVLDPVDLAVGFISVPRHTTPTPSTRRTRCGRSR